jgi:uncharacterized protein (TIGR02271 family)
MTLPPDPQTGLDRSDQPAAGAAPEVVRSEERLVVRTDLRPTRRLRLRKRVVTEEVTHTVTVRREELVVDEEDLTGTTAAPGAQHDFGDREVEIVLHEERVVTSTRVVPVERVRVRVTTVTDQVEVEEVLRREEIDVQTVPVTELDTGGTTTRTT